MDENERVRVARVNPLVLWQRLPDGAVLLDPATEVYFGLDPVGARVWEFMTEGIDSLGELCAAIVREYPDADAATVRTDVTELIEELESNGLLLAQVTNLQKRVPLEGIV